MTSHRSSVQPPRAAAWLVELFASPHETDGILGDLAEDFSADVERDGDALARRRYRRQAWRTIVDLALSPLRLRQPAGAAKRTSGVLFAVAVGFFGLFTIWPVALGINLSARALVTHYPVYYYVSAPAFWTSVDLLVPFISGVLVALGARALRFRPMSAAVATLAFMAVVLAVDQPLMMWLYGPPRVAEITFVSTVVRWARGMLLFGGLTLAGAAIGRLLPLRLRSPRLPSAAG
jgi:hypothetical protein